MNVYMENDMDAQNRCMHNCILISTWLTLEHTLRIGSFNFSGKEKQICLFWSISVVKKKSIKKEVQKREGK